MSIDKKWLLQDVLSFAYTVLISTSLLENFPFKLLLPSNSLCARYSKSKNFKSYETQRENLLIHLLTVDTIDVDVFFKEGSKRPPRILKFSYWVKRGSSG